MSPCVNWSWKPAKFACRNPESISRNLESTSGNPKFTRRNPKSDMPLDSFTYGEKEQGFRNQMGVDGSLDYCGLRHFMAFKSKISYLHFYNVYIVFPRWRLCKASYYHSGDKDFMRICRYT